ncbi:hypothetical protein Tco_0492651, partial [Tanacetum coccineum]
VAEKLQADCDLKATNIILQGTKLSLQEKECKLYDEFDKFSFVKGETLYQYYRRFAQLINNMNVINIPMRPVQVNIKFLNSLLPEWSKFMTDVELARDLHTTNYGQLYSYLEQHEAHANETCLMCERYQDPLAFVSNFNQPPSYITIILNTMLHSFLNRDDPIACLNKEMAFLSAVATLRFPSTNNQLRTSSNLRNQAIQDDRAVLMANLSNYGSDVISEVPHSESYRNGLDNQSVHAMHDFEQTPVVDFLDNEITSDSNIIPYS